jgi:hypothetical protein
MAVNDMQNFVFITRNPEYVLDVVSWMFPICLLYFLIMPLFSFWTIFIIVITIIILFITFLFRTNIEIEKNEIIVKKSFTLIPYYTYKSNFETITIIEDAISFVNKDYLIIFFLNDGVPIEFSLLTIEKKEIIIGNEKSYKKFKESLEEWQIGNIMDK